MLIIELEWGCKELRPLPGEQGCPPNISLFTTLDHNRSRCPSDDNNG